MKDAIGLQQCGSCRHFHVPNDNNKMGVCVAHPPTPFFLGFAPGATPVITSTPPQPVPVVRSFYTPVAAAEGCHEHEPVDRAN